MRAGSRTVGANGRQSSRPRTVHASLAPRVAVVREAPPRSSTAVRRRVFRDGAGNVYALAMYDADGHLVSWKDVRIDERGALVEAVDAARVVVESFRDGRTVTTISHRDGHVSMLMERPQAA